MRDRLSRERNQFHTRLAHVSVNRVLMLSFLLLFGLTVGPFNLFYLARHHRPRLLWTTPLISVLASVVLMALILLQDGVGGHGHRSVVVLSMPDRATELVMQEQISRTGVLLSTTFPEVEGAFLEAIQLQDRIHGTRSFSLARGRHAGEWFTTRSVQAQRIEIVRGSRSRVEMLGDGRLASTLPVTVERLLIVDDKGAFWMARNVQPGDPFSLEPAPEAEVQDFFGDHLEHVTPLARMLIDRQRGRTNTFFAAGAGPIAIDTLPAISWSDDPVLFLGPVETKR
jgi:hypothetical protein